MNLWSLLTSQPNLLDEFQKWVRGPDWRWGEIADDLFQGCPLASTCIHTQNVLERY